MMIFPHSGAVQTVYITKKTRNHVIDFLIQEKILHPDDPIIPIIAAFIDQTNVGEVRIRNRLRLVFP